MRHIESDQFTLTDSAVALGKFEGLHRGHQLLFREIIKQKERGFHSVVFTFNVHPKSLFHKGEGAQRLFTTEERNQILEDFGIETMIEYPFTMEFASLAPEEFIRDILVKKAGAKVVVVGADFRFGKKRCGSVEDLRQCSGKYGYDLIVIPKLQSDGSDVSSSRIRALLSEGKMEEVTELLGRPYSILGEVVHGKALGRTIQIPTANQICDAKKCMPPNGVYYSKTFLDGKAYYGITNIGVKPTVEEDEQKGAETYLFDFDGDLYGRTIRVELLHHSRKEQRFDDLSALVAQMNQDIASAKEYVKALAS